MNGRFVRMPLLGSWKSGLSAEPGPSHPVYGVPGNRKGGGTTTVGTALAVECAIAVEGFQAVNPSKVNSQPFFTLICDEPKLWVFGRLSG